MGSDTTILTEDAKASGVEVNTVSEIKKAGLQIDSLSEQLEGFFKELKETQISCNRMQEEGAGFREKLAKASDLSMELDRIETVAQGVADNLSQKSSQLGSLAASIKEISTALRRCLKNPLS